MTTTDLYKKLKAGEITEQKFLYEVRRDQNLPFVTNINSFKDAVQILKNKGIIREEKQEVEIFAKTLDMVNPYEYTRGMNFELDVVIDSVGNKLIDGATGNNIEEITPEEIKKAQKKVLKNLTKDPYFYQKKLIPQMEGETEDVVEVNPKSIEALKKKAGKVIREHGEHYDDVSNVMEDNIEELGRTRDSIYEKYAKKYEVDVNELKDRVEARRLEKKDGLEREDGDGHIGGNTDRDFEREQLAQLSTRNEAMDKATKLAIADEIAQWRKGNLSKAQLKKSLMDLSDGEFQLDSIKGFNNEAITVSDEDTAIKIAKKDPNADVKVMKMEYDTAGLDQKVKTDPNVRKAVQKATAKAEKGDSSDLAVLMALGGK